MRQVPVAPRYWATEGGEIWDEQSQRFKVQTLTGIPQYKYTQIYFPDGSKKLMRVHRLVAMAWHDQTEGLDFVDHRDQDKMNNHKDNLRWVTKTGNAQNRDVNIGSTSLRQWLRDNHPDAPDKIYHRMRRSYAKNPSPGLETIYLSIL